MIVFIAVIGVIPLALAAAVLRGYVFSILWGWFIVPTFGVPSISTPLAIGIMITIGEVTRQYVPTKDKDIWMPIGTAILSPLLALLLGWIVRFWL
jgi:hypothetical protein